MSGASSSDEDSYGPTLPPHLQAPKVIGPQLPPMLKQDKSPNNSTIKGNDLLAQSKEYDEHEEDDEADDGIGPYPPDDPRSQRIPKAVLELSKDEAPPKREEWMLVCPKNKTISEVIGQVGLGPRKFLGRTPDEVKPPDEEQEEPDFLETARAEFEDKCGQERDAKMSEMLHEANSLKDKESLLALHRKRKKMEETGPTERRPFDRDVDLKVGGLSEEDKEKFIKKSTELGTRFCGGKRKFL